jgi:hypothetical protein
MIGKGMQGLLLVQGLFAALAMTTMAHGQAVEVLLDPPVQENGVQQGPGQQGEVQEFKPQKGNQDKQVSKVFFLNSGDSAEIQADDQKHKAEMVEILMGKGSVVKGKPYAAESETTSVQILTDGNRMQHRTVSKFFRDSEGRTRREQTFGNVDPSNPGPHEVKVFVDDPVSNTSYVLDPGEKSARRLMRSMKFLHERDAESSPKAIILPDLNEGRNIVKKDLGKKTIEGLECVGTQTTTTIPAGQIGNERPIVIVSESWYSPAIEATVQSSTTDPRFGQTTYQLQNVQVGEQQRDLFEAPADYKIENPR